MTIRLFVADDHPVFVRTLALLFSGDQTGEGQDFELVGTAPDGETAVERCVALQPDVVLMDLQMPGIGGIEATRRLVDAAPHIAVIALTMFDDDASVSEALAAGARGYLVKGSRQSDIQRVIEMVHEGHAVLGRAVVQHLPALASPSRRIPALPPFPELTQREREVLDSLADGLDNAAISRRLHLSQKTVRNYVSLIFAKLHVESRAEAVVKARTKGLGTAQTRNDPAM
ncbi:MAG: response regulator transcription factor [Actinobacteria bacterium]|nr:response regulator transcription factor [Actinomycetota bacterium]